MIVQKLFVLIYKFYISFSDKCRTAYFMSRVKASTPPRIIGKVHLHSSQVSIGKNVTIYPGVYFWGNKIEIGDNVDIGIGTIIYSRNGVKIGDNTTIAGQCYIIDSNHGIKLGIPIKEQPMESAEDGIVIGRDVWIGAQCSILKGAKINDGAIVGAQSLVNKEIPSNAVVYGSPALIRTHRG